MFLSQIIQQSRSSLFSRVEPSRRSWVVTAMLVVGLVLLLDFLLSSVSNRGSLLKSMLCLPLVLLLCFLCTCGMMTSSRFFVMCESGTIGAGEDFIVIFILASESCAKDVFSHLVVINRPSLSSHHFSSACHFSLSMQSLTRRPPVSSFL